MSYPSVVLADNPTNYWRLNEGAGSATAVDSGSSPINGGYGTATAPGQPSSPIDPSGTSTQFSGSTTNGMVQITTTGSHYTFMGTGSTGFSFECIAKPSNFTQQYCRILEISNGNGTIAWMIEGTNSATAGLLSPAMGYYENATPFPQQFAQDTATYSGWIHIVGTATFSGGNLTLVLYVNGTQTATSTAAAPTLPAGYQYSYIGYNVTGNADFLGFAQDIAIYNYPLTATQVSNHYNAATTPQAANVSPPASRAVERSSIPVGFRGTGEPRDAQFPPKTTAPPTANSASARGFAANPSLHIGVNITPTAATSIALTPTALAGGGTSFAGATAHCFGFAVPTIAQPMATISPPSAISLAVVGDPATEVAGDVFPGATGFALGNAGSPIIESGIPAEVDPSSASAVAVVAPPTSPTAGVNISPSASVGWAEAPATTGNAGVAATVAPTTAISTALAPRPSVSVVATLHVPAGEAMCVTPFVTVTIVRPWTEAASLGFVPVADQE